MVDVIIIGAGPSGLMMAIEILRQGLTCRIIDKASGPSDKSKALAIQARSIEVLDHIGIADACLAEGLKITKFIPMSGGKKIAEISFDLIQSPFPFVLSLEQSKFENILIQYLAKFDCKVERGIELLSFDQNQDDVHLSLKDLRTDKVTRSTTSWLIACDGPHSSIRKQLGLTFEGKSLPEIISLADLDIDWKYPHEQGRAFIDKNGLLAAIPIKSKNRYRFIFKLERTNRFLLNQHNPDHGEIAAASLQPPTIEEVTHVVRKNGDPDAIIKNAYWLTNFQINSRIVKRFQERRVFLVGDAAHIHSPAGGQGMNTGLQDAFNLGWKLALVHKKIANPSLLESYMEERHFVGKNLLKGTETGTAIIMLGSPFLIHLRNTLMHLMGAFTFFRRKIASIIAQISIRYPESVWIIQKKMGFHARAGIRAPDASIVADGGKTTLFVLWKKTLSFHVLFIDLHKTSPGLDTQAKVLEKEYYGLVKVHVISGIEDEIQARYGDRNTYLIRPDGYIGYCGPLEDLESLHTYLKRLLQS